MAVAMSFFMHTAPEGRLPAELAGARRGGQGENLPYPIAHG